MTVRLDMWRALTALLRCFPPEIAHGLSICALRAGVHPRMRDADDPILAGEIWGRRLPSPIGVAAGYDKGAQVADALIAMGFGFVEVGTVTPRPQPGNPKPRLFRLAEDRALINRLGFNSEGLAVARARLARRKGRAGVVGANVGKNKETVDAAADYAEGARALAPLADYLVINVSSPNTPGLRALQRRADLAALIGAVRAALPPSPPPLLVKVAPDLSPAEREDMAAVSLECAVDGLIIANTTLARPDGLRSAHRGEVGGLSGRPLMALSTEVLADLHRLTGGRVPLIGCGGVSSGADAYAKIRAGARLVQLYTALVYDGPGLLPRIKAELAARLRADGFRSVAEAVGTAKTAG